MKLVSSDKFVMGHTMLYAKGWYKQGDEIWKDYQRVITADGVYDPYDCHEVAYFLLEYLLTNIDKLVTQNTAFKEMFIHEEIRENIKNIEAWAKYDTEKLKKRRRINFDNLAIEDVYDLAVILTCHYIFCHSNLDNFNAILSPSENVLPLKDSTDEEFMVYYHEIFDDKNYYIDEKQKKIIDKLPKLN